MTVVTTVALLRVGRLTSSVLYELPPSGCSCLETLRVDVARGTWGTQLLYKLQENNKPQRKEPRRVTKGGDTRAFSLVSDPCYDRCAPTIVFFS